MLLQKYKRLYPLHEVTTEPADTSENDDMTFGQFRDIVKGIEKRPLPTTIKCLEGEPKDWYEGLFKLA